MLIKYFKVKKNTNRFSKNQKVWVIHEYGNHAHIRFKWRGKGRYVNGIIATKHCTSKYNWNIAIGEEGIKEIEVSDDFGSRLISEYK